MRLKVLVNPISQLNREPELEIVGLYIFLLRVFKCITPDFNKNNYFEKYIKPNLSFYIICDFKIYY